MKYSKCYHVHKAATWMLFLSAAILYLTNILLSLFVWNDTAWDFLTTLVFPFVAAGAIYELDWKHEYISNWALSPSLKPVLESVLTVMVAVAVILFFYDSSEVALLPAVLPLIVLARLAYIWAGSSKIAIICMVCTSLLFILTLALLPYNVAGILTLLVGTPALLMSFPSFRYLYWEEKGWKQSVLATAAFLLGAFAILALPRAQEYLQWASYGRPSLWDTASINEVCREMISSAPLLGSADSSGFPIGFSESGREYAVTLATIGLVPWLIITTCAVLMVLCSIYLSWYAFGLQKFFVVAVAILVSLQTMASALLAFGIDLLFPLAAPLLGSGLENTLYLLLVAVILPPKQTHLEGEDEDIWSRLLSIPLS